jgi:gliding motility-associated lipoprotein GldD
MNKQYKFLKNKPTQRKIVLKNVGVRVGVFLMLLSCGDSPLPKPSSYLRLDYPNANYKRLDLKIPYQFEHAERTVIIQKQNNWVDLYYPDMKATLVMTYRPVNENLRDLFVDAEKLTFKHMIKADDIQSLPYENPASNVYGRVFEVFGNAATQIQFHATDSTDNFLTGALYFYAKPNYDSILPAVQHLKKDIVHLMESLEWKN